MTLSTLRNKSITDYCLNLISDEYKRVQGIKYYIKQSLYHKLDHTFKLMDNRVLPYISRDVIRLSMQMSDCGKKLRKTRDFEGYFTIVYKLFIALLCCSYNSDKHYYSKMLKKL